MIRALTLLCAACLMPACDRGPMLGAGLTVGPGGAALRPHMVGAVGGLDVAIVSPPIR